MSNKKAKESKSNSPLLIIVGVLVVAALGGWYYYTSKASSPASRSNTATNTAANKPKISTIPAGAPPGAQPPNQSGSQSASVRIEEFADFQCSSCAQVNPIFNEIKSTYGAKIHFVFRHFPLPNHAKSYDAAVASEAAGMQNRFWDMQHQLLSNQQAWTNSPSHKEIWKAYAEKIGLDVAKWETDMLGIGAKSRVDADLTRAKAIGVNSTPTLYINGALVPYTEINDAQKLKGIIDAELAKAAQQNTATGSAPPPSGSNSNP
jgi:protein-disulfide isomerase